MSDKRIFDNIEEINQIYNVDLKLPVNIPEGCNIICYKVTDLYNVEYFWAYKEDDYLYHYTHSGWKKSNEDLESEVKEDLVGGTTYLYLLLKPVQEVNEDKIKFTPERLLGVKTKEGYITHVYNINGNIIVILNDIHLHYYYPESLYYYISDNSDKTVSYDEYVEMFYGR